MAYSRQWYHHAVQQFSSPFSAQVRFVCFSCTLITVACVSSSVLVSDLNGKSGLLVSLSLSLPSDVLLCVPFCPF